MFTDKHRKIKFEHKFCCHIIMGMFEHKFVKIYKIGQSSGLVNLAQEQFQFFFSNFYNLYFVFGIVLMSTLQLILCFRIVLMSILQLIHVYFVLE
jgi:hypothetical protein